MEKTCRRMLGTSKPGTMQDKSAKTYTQTKHEEDSPTQPPDYETTYASPAEQTLQKHRIDPKIVETASGPRPHDSETGFISPYPVGFLGCLGCGATDHSLFKGLIVKPLACTLLRTSSNSLR